MREPHRDAIFVASEGLEYEQQESINAVYVVAHEGGRVLGSERPLRTDDECPSIGGARHSYMSRDAHLGHLPALPADLLYDRDRADFVQGSDGLVWPGVSCPSPFARREGSRRASTVQGTCRGLA